MNRVTSRLVALIFLAGLIVDRLKKVKSGKSRGFRFDNCINHFRSVQITQKMHETVWRVRVSKISKGGKLGALTLVEIPKHLIIPIDTENND